MELPLRDGTLQVTIDADRGIDANLRGADVDLLIAAPADERRGDRTDT